MTSVSLERVSQRFNRVVALDDITFEVPNGQLWVLVGPSGCGKSTILRAIAGLEPVTTGNVFIGGRLVNGVPARQRNVAMVFQNYALYPHMSVAENLAFGLRMRQAERSTIRERVDTVARILNISHLLERKPRQLSGGQQQRVALGRAIARNAEVFLLDEPLSNLDAQLRDDTRAELKQLHQQLGVTTLYVTHDQTEAMTLADQIVVLNQGHIQQIGTPQQTYQHPVNRMVASFMGTPAMNIFPALWEGETFRVGDQRISCPEAIQRVLLGVNFPDSNRQDSTLSGTRFPQVDLGIRPEAMRLSESSDPDPTTPAPTTLPLIITVVEPLGRETLIRGTLPSSSFPLTLALPPTLNPQVGDRLLVSLNLSQLFVFNPVSGVTLYPSGNV